LGSDLNFVPLQSAETARIAPFESRNPPMFPVAWTGESQRMRDVSPLVRG